MVAVWQGMRCRPERGSHRLLCARQGACFRGTIKDDCEAWKTSFARDQRASFIQNHDHDCTGTCVKYQKKKNATEPLQRAGQKIAGPGVPKCRFRFFRYVALQIEGMLKYVVRRGKELVKEVCITTCNEEKVWQNSCAASDTLQVFLLRRIAINAPVQRRLSIPEESCAGPGDESRGRISIPDESRGRVSKTDDSRDR